MARPDLWLLLDAPLGDPLVGRVGAAVMGGADVDDIQEALLSAGLREAPDFAVVAIEGEGLRVLARGALAVTGADPEGPVTVRGRRLCADALLPGARALTADVAPADGAVTEDPAAAAGDWSLLGGGMVPAAALSIDFTGGEAAPVVVAPDVDVEVEVEVESEPTLAVEQGVDAAPHRNSDPEPDPEADAAIREYERLFGAPEATIDAAPAPSGVAPTDLQGEVPVESPAERPLDTRLDARFETPAVVHEPPPVVHDTPAVAAYAAEPAPAPAGGIIESLPDFFGPLAGSAASDPVAVRDRFHAPAPSSPAAGPGATQWEPADGIPPWSDPTLPPPAAAPSNPAGPSVASPGSAEDRVASGASPAQRPEPASAAPAAAPTGGPSVPTDAAAVSAKTVNRAHLRDAGAPTGPTVWAARCPVGHASQAFAATCRVCGQFIAPQEPQEIPRPVLGRLVVPGGAPILLDSDLVLGRDPRVPQDASAARPRLVVLNDPRMEVSSQHASITLNFWDVCLTDLGSTNGTEIITPDGRRQRLAQHTPVTITPQTRIVLAEVLELLFEATG
jgi:hypothetical protein